MPGTQPRERVKHRPWRTTEVEVVEAGGVACVKRFHDARWPSSMGGRVVGRVVGRWRDRRRARLEAQRLQELAQAGLAVPEVLGVSETPEGVELRTRWISGARTVAEILESPAGPPDRLATKLGRLLASLHCAGFVHGDLHPGNVVVDAEQRAWLVDVAAIRRERGPGVGDLIQAVAHAREVTTPRFRARFLVAFLRGAPQFASALHRMLRDDPRLLADALERAGREERRRYVEAESDRWLRESGVCAVHVEGDVTVLVPHTVERTTALLLVRRALDGDALDGFAIAEQEEARAAWICAARLVEHHVPVLRPIALVVRPRPLALFERPADAREADAHRGADAHGLGTLAGTLSDRLLASRRAGAVFDAHGVAHLDPRSGLDALSRPGLGLAPWQAFVPPADRARFAAAFLQAQRGSKQEREEMLAELDRG